MTRLPNKEALRIGRQSEIRLYRVRLYRIRLHRIRLYGIRLRRCMQLNQSPFYMGL